MLTSSTVKSKRQQQHPWQVIMLFCIFSYNRGNFLKNCVQSIESCSPDSKIAVFDDDSDDTETISVLRDLGEKHTVFTSTEHSSHHLGGLYNNMQNALEYCQDEELVCFLQDDRADRPLQFPQPK
ncbi:MAG: glycosyltransferase [Desulfurivibrio sp.]|nr:glycosyltransferase [Desulfurivibrio sp.]